MSSPVVIVGASGSSASMIACACASARSEVQALKTLARGWSSAPARIAARTVGSRTVRSRARLARLLAAVRLIVNAVRISCIPTSSSLTWCTPNSGSLRRIVCATASKSWARS